MGIFPKTLIDQVLKAGELSRFMGSPTKDIDKLLIMPSAMALEHEGQYFSFLGGKMVRRFEADFAAISALDPGQNFDERALAGAVFTYEGMDFTRLQIEAGPSKRCDAGEGLFDPAHFE